MRMYSVSEGTTASSHSVSTKDFSLAVSMVNLALSVEAKWLIRIDDFQFFQFCSSNFRGCFPGGGVNHEVPNSGRNNRCRTVEKDIENRCGGAPELIETIHLSRR